MENLSQTDPEPPPVGAPSEPVKPGPCQYYIGSGLVLSLAGALLVWLGMYVQRLWPEGPGQFAVLGLGLIVLLVGLSVLARGMMRAAAAVDYLVHQSR